MMSVCRRREVPAQLLTYSSDFGAARLDPCELRTVVPYTYPLSERSAELHDPRTSSWWLMSGPGPLLTILATYLYFCLSIGPRYMRDRKPYNLKNTIIVYNVSQVVMSIFLVYEGLVAGWWEDYSFTCQPVDYSDSPKAKRMAAAVWWYFLAKLIELSDTVFFVLRKKNKQISVLHLYHHFMMPICAWIGTKFLPGGHGTLLGVINSFIHIIMYTYYLISGLGPEYQKYLWWKQHVTTLQLIQFCIVFYHNGSVMFRDCNYPKGINFLLTLNAGIFLYMFGNFYYTNYIKKEIHKKGIPVQKTSAIKGHVIREKIEAVANGKLKDS
ncbi:Elongation of very long chain fatty acids protein AAEL008004 [Eumeta japonica]|uniref:Elongation of very long chain fatty acids protein n=1 Tax=Eumeta variegata TaxID=151549 RepID=A0A4C1YY68_EUMVA|nr:Elongation of very long chain fatty acids protein AAEL008004 [Eumeta japonica]